MRMGDRVCVGVGACEDTAGGDGVGVGMAACVAVGGPSSPSAHASDRKSMLRHTSPIRARVWVCLATMPDHLLIQVEDAALKQPHDLYHHEDV